MKRWVKGLLIGGAVCIGLGSAICLGGWAMGGRFFYYRDRNFGITEERGWDGPAGQGELEPVREAPQAPEWGQDDGIYNKAEQDESGPLKSGAAEEARSGNTIVRELEIEVLGGWVEVVTDDSTDQIVVTSSNENYQCRQELEEDKLEIYVGLQEDLWVKNLWTDRFGNYQALGEAGDEPAARIKIPAGVTFRKADVQVKGGMLQIGQLYAEKLELETEAGVLEILDGDVQDLETECKVGEVTYQGRVDAHLEAECAAGDIRCILDGKKEDFSYKVEVKTGSVVIDGEETTALNQEQAIDSPGAVKKARLECKTGAIDVSFKQETAAK